LSTHLLASMQIQFSGNERNNCVKSRADTIAWLFFAYSRPNSSGFIAMLDEEQNSREKGEAHEAKAGQTI
ncbi:hypothetical protein P4U99_07225, partial [Brevibacillus agri]|uniref:hypothetical protein n=1 Tax=Brevibacillus agri TaxID=51101 RepID=UPI002E22CAF6|nr:hypothetical protein [Brevibacillus agri]MED1689554.1 hypothetical protein [Brevibacillus agri]